MTQENLLAENAELKRKLAEAEAEAKLASCLCWESEHCPLHSIGIAEAEARVLEQRCRAEAAERELAEAEARSKEEKGRRQAAEADLRKTEEHRLAAVAQSVRYERKCAELSEALRWMDRKGGLGLDVHERIKAALASQPAPEAKPVPLVLYCPAGHLHVDEGEWATRPHKTHQCQRPAAPSDAKAGER
jgi:hypothetical protein